jgi:hypothetical protein
MVADISQVERKLSVIGSGGYIAVVIVGSFIGYLVSAHLADSIEARKLLIYAVSSVGGSWQQPDTVSDARGAAHRRQCRMSY